MSAIEKEGVTGPEYLDCASAKALQRKRRGAVVKHHSKTVAKIADDLSHGLRLAVVACAKRRRIPQAGVLRERLERVPDWREMVAPVGLTLDHRLVEALAVTPEEITLEVTSVELLPPEGLLSLQASSRVWSHVVPSWGRAKKDSELALFVRPDDAFDRWFLDMERIHREDEFWFATVRAGNPDGIHHRKDLPLNFEIRAVLVDEPSWIEEARAKSPIEGTDTFLEMLGSKQVLTFAQCVVRRGRSSAEIVQLPTSHGVTRLRSPLVVGFTPDPDLELLHLEVWQDGKLVTPPIELREASTAVALPAGSYELRARVPETLEVLAECAVRLSD
ncbi:MAG TPA: hypothetical protein VJN18_27065 [Polyangiaceae bacterium]|nr:hypothetical protein [Polyangiaceae bacterium]